MKSEITQITAWSGADVFTDRVFRICVNLGARRDRWKEFTAQTRRMNLPVHRQAGVMAQTVLDARGYEETSRYACSLAKRLALRRGRLSGAEAVLLMEDDAVFAPGFAAQLRAIQFPADWGILFLGCRHNKKPVPLGGGLVRVVEAIDHHAMLVRAPYIKDAIAGLAGAGKGAEPQFKWSDEKMAALQQHIPTYAILPNLVWQRRGYSSAAGKVMGHYDRKGCQLQIAHEIKSVIYELERMDAVAAEESGEEAQGPDRQTEAVPTPVQAKQLTAAMSYRPWAPQPTLKFLEGAAKQHSLEKTFASMVYINLAKRDDRRGETEYQFLSQGMRVKRHAAMDVSRAKNLKGHDKTAYGNFNAVGSYGCALSHRQILRQAKREGAESVLIFEDDVILHPKFREFAEAIDLPDDWGVFYYGVVHTRPPELIRQGLVRVRSGWTTHAYAVRARYYERIMHAMRYGADGSDLNVCDVTLGRMTDEIPMYAVYPNLAWQAGSFSDIDGNMKKQFHDNGRQGFSENNLRELDYQLHCLEEAKNTAL